jgi:hypothetical protein
LVRRAVRDHPGRRTNSLLLISVTAPPSCLPASAFSLLRASNAGPSLPLSWCGVDERLGAVAQRPRRGLSTSGPRRGGLSCPRHGSATAPTARSWADQRGRPGTSGSPVDLAPSPSHEGATSLPRRVVAVGPPSPVNSIRQQGFILPSSKEMLRCAKSTCCKHMFSSV